MRRSIRGVFAAALLIAAVLLAWPTLGFTYSVGDRVGFAQMTAKTGWICRGYTGGLSITGNADGSGSAFRFDVRDSAVAKQLDELAGQKVAVHYVRRKGIRSECFRGSGYFVTAVRKIN